MRSPLDLDAADRELLSGLRSTAAALERTNAPVPVLERSNFASGLLANIEHLQQAVHADVMRRPAVPPVWPRSQAGPFARADERRSNRYISFST